MASAPNSVNVAASCSLRSPSPRTALGLGHPSQPSVPSAFRTSPRSQRVGPIRFDQPLQQRNFAADLLAAFGVARGAGLVPFLDRRRFRNDIDPIFDRCFDRFEMIMHRQKRLLRLQYQRETVVAVRF